MSNSVDQRIVEMQFDNAQFEKGVQSTMSSLRNLESSLGKTYNGKRFSGISETVKNLGFDIAEKAVGSFGNALSGLQGIAANVFGGIAEHVNGFVKAFALVQGVLNTGLLGYSIAGGIKRATNLNQANFKLEGLLSKYEDKAEKMATIVENAQYAVLDTAYGYDSAIKAAGVSCVIAKSFARIFQW